MDISILKKYDKSKMYEIYDEWPNIARNSYNKKFEPISYKNINHIVFAGMGGSGSIGTIFESILSKNNIHVSIVKGYLLPKTVDVNTLVIATSISGNTVETLEVLKLAHKSDCKVVGLSSGGKVEKFCEKHSLEYRKISQFHSPRASFSSFLYSMLNIFNPLIPISKQEVTESIRNLEKVRIEIGSTNISESNPSLKLANWIKGIPLIYYPNGLQSAAIRFKNSLQENAKIHAITEDVLETSHNGIVAWEKPSECRPILIQGKDDYSKTKQRWKIIKEYFQDNNVDYYELHSIQGHILSKLITLIYLFDYSSIYYAVNTKTDPSPIKSINYIKNKLKNSN